MKVKCIKLSVDKPSIYVTNGQMQGYIELNREFIVYGLSFQNNITYVYIFDNNHLLLVPIELFEIIDNNLPSGLQIKVWEHGEVTMHPELFYREWFIDMFSDYEPEERKLFEDLKLKMDY